MYIIGLDPGPGREQPTYSQPKPGLAELGLSQSVWCSNPTFYSLCDFLAISMQIKQAVRKKRNFKNLALESSPVVPVSCDATLKSGKQEEYDKLYKDLSDLEIGLELRLDLRAEDLKALEELGAGNGGTVCKVLHIPTKTIMAKKTIYPRSLLDSPAFPEWPSAEIPSTNSVPLSQSPVPETTELHPKKSVSYSLPGAKTATLPNSTDYTHQRVPMIQTKSQSKKPPVNQRLLVRKQIMREMQFLHDCNSKHIVSFYGAFMNDGDISICMEYMDVGSLDTIYKKSGPISMDILKKIAYAIVDGLIYLYDCHRIIHRDLKPSNVLVNSAGQIKICDFGVSGQLIDSVANTFVGTSSYMSPERILGSPYSVKSDVWSIGITLMELALGRFPFAPDGKSLAIFELLQYIVNEPAPALPKDTYPLDFEQFLGMCLVKDVNARATPSELMKTPYLESAANLRVDLESWAKSHQEISK
ncbi:MAP kinase kinase (MEK) [Apophysomyces ossiformis]|uniref:MAP kinase kinase (MEK) n=1 Tax=Apophysomyces ossiformis TaxID=679940 RepID=A0A8H7BWT9_9FUNG|nr:MAP kinase kinase (MEK) [Apophysomyces ossiformis]